MDEWLRVASVGDCPLGGLVRVEAAGERIVLANVDGELYALLDQCTHQDYPLSDGILEGDRLECIYHGARFNADGTPRAPAPLQMVPQGQQPVAPSGPARTR